MTQKAALTAGAALLVAGAGAIALINRGDPPAEISDPTVLAPSPATSGGLAPVDDTAARQRRPRPRDPGENPDLFAKYGESRTNLSKHIAGNVIGLLDDAVEMGEMVASGELGNAFGGPRATLRMSLGRIGNELELTEEQQDEAVVLYKDYQQREIVRSKETIGRLKKDPTALMQLMLASDAYARGEITEDEYADLQKSSGEDLEGVVNPLDGAHFRGGQPLEDETFRASFVEVLDASQREKLQVSLAEEVIRKADQGDTRGITHLPAMELEKLDETVESAKKMAIGFKNVMEGRAAGSGSADGTAAPAP